MTFSEALALVRSNARRADHPDLRLHLAVGFTANHLATFLTAQACRRRQDRRIVCTIGPYGDVIEALAAPAARQAHAVLAVIEWADLDPRLGLRRFAPGIDAAADMIGTVSTRLDMIAVAIGDLAKEVPVVLSLPSLPLPPVFPMPAGRTGLAETSLRRRLLDFAERCLATPGVRAVDDSRLDRVSPARERRSAASELGADMPYAVGHLAALADALVLAAFPPAPLKGLITDLDDTLWRGLVGEVGANGVSWNLDAGSQIHAVYQGLLSGLADLGVLVAVASKNAPEVAGRALDRQDLRLDRERLYPIEIGWGAKSEAVERILARWNVGPDAVAFVDDSPMEVAEVQARFPEVTGLVFPTTDDAAALELIERLRDLFGRERVSEDDRIRAASLRSGEAVAQASRGEGGSSEAFLESLGATLTFDFGIDPDDARPLDLVNKTNQFNLNGRRIESADWKRDLRNPERFAVAIGYADKFGPLGTISVAAGSVEGTRAVLTTWVLSCRAFARRIEHATLAVLADRLGVGGFTFDLAKTDKNDPVRGFFAALGANSDADGSVKLDHSPDTLPPLYHKREIRDR